MAGGFFVTALGGLPGLFVLAVGVVLTILGLIGLVIGWGLWTLQPWARVLALVFVILAFVVNLASIVAGNFGGGVVGVIIDLLLLWYLTRPGVKAAFTPRPGLRAPA